MSQKTLVVLAHPDLARSKINAAWAAALAGLDGVTVRDIHALYPDGKIDVAAEQAAVRAHDRVIFQFPLFWFSVPPLLKAWFDQVLAYGFVYGPGGDALEGKSIGVAISTGGKAEAYRAGAQNGWTLDELLRPIQATARFCRADYEPIFTLNGAMWGLTDDQIAASARAYAAWVAGEEVARAA